MTWAPTFQFWEPEGLPEIFLRQQPCYNHFNVFIIIIITIIIIIIIIIMYSTLDHIVMYFAPNK